MPYFPPQQTAIQILNKLKTVDGSGSGLDADTIDGLHANELSTVAALNDLTDVTISTPSTNQVLLYNGSIWVNGTITSGVTDHGALTGLSDNDHSQYLLAIGSTTGATASRQVFTSGITTGSIRPSSDSTTALQLQKADGTSVVTVDTTNRGVGINTSYIGARLHVASDTASGQYAGLFQLNNIQTVWSNTLATFTMTNADNTTGNHAVFTFTDAIGGPSSVGIGAAFVDRTNHYGDFYFYTKGAEDGYAQRIYVKSSGLVAIGGTSPTALLDLAASISTRSSLRIRHGVAPTSPNDGDIWNDGNALALHINGTNAVNTDGGLSVFMQSSINSRNVGRLLWQYLDKTDATRITRGKLTAFYTSTEQESIRWDANSAGIRLGFYGVSAVARQTVPTGSSIDDVITALQNLGLFKQS